MMESERGRGVAPAPAATPLAGSPLCVLGRPQRQPASPQAPASKTQDRVLQSKHPAHLVLDPPKCSLVWNVCRTSAWSACLKASPPPGVRPQQWRHPFRRRANAAFTCTSTSTIESVKHDGDGTSFSFVKRTSPDIALQTASMPACSASG